MFYLITFALILIVLLYQQNFPQVKKLLEFPLMLLIFLPIGLRGDVGTDTYYYYFIFERVASLDSFDIQALTALEPLTLFIMYFSSLFGGSYTFFLLVFSIISGLLFHSATYGMKGRIIFIVFYLLMIHLIWNANAMRFGLSFLFFMNAYKYREDIKKKSFFMIGAVLSHLSILVFYPVLMKLKLDKKFMGAAFILLLVAWFNYDYIAAKISGYGILDSKPTISFLGVLMVSALWAGMAFKKNRSYELITVTSIFSIVMLLSGYNDIIYRVLQPAVILLLYVVFYESTIKSIKTPLIMAVFLIGTYFSINYILAVKNERSVIMSTGAGGILDFTLLPYSGFCSSKYRFDDPMLELFCK